MNKLFMISILIGIIVLNGCSTDSSKAIPGDVCIYNSEKYIICGTPFVLVSEGKEINLVANEPFYFPQGNGKLISLVDLTKPEGERAFLVFLEEGRHTINKETSRRAVGSFLAK